MPTAKPFNADNVKTLVGFLLVGFGAVLSFLGITSTEISTILRNDQPAALLVFFPLLAAIIAGLLAAVVNGGPKPELGFLYAVFCFGIAGCILVTNLARIPLVDLITARYLWDGPTFEVVAFPIFFFFGLFFLVATPIFNSHLPGKLESKKQEEAEAEQTAAGEDQKAAYAEKGAAQAEQKAAEAENDAEAVEAAKKKVETAQKRAAEAERGVIEAQARVASAKADAARYRTGAAGIRTEDRKTTSCWQKTKELWKGKGRWRRCWKEWRKCWKEWRTPRWVGNILNTQILDLPSLLIIISVVLIGVSILGALRVESGVQDFSNIQLQASDKTDSSNSDLTFTVAASRMVEGDFVVVSISGIPRASQTPQSFGPARALATPTSASTALPGCQRTKIDPTGCEVNCSEPAITCQTIANWVVHPDVTGTAKETTSFAVSAQEYSRVVGSVVLCMPSKRQQPKSSSKLKQHCLTISGSHVDVQIPDPPSTTSSSPEPAPHPHPPVCRHWASPGLDPCSHKMNFAG